MGYIYTEVDQRTVHSVQCWALEYSPQCSPLYHLHSSMLHMFCSLNRTYNYDQCTLKEDLMFSAGTCRKPRIQYSAVLALKRKTYETKLHCNRKSLRMSGPRHFLIHPSFNIWGFHDQWFILGWIWSLRFWFPNSSWILCHQVNRLFTKLPARLHPGAQEARGCWGSSARQLMWPSFLVLR